MTFRVAAVLAVTLMARVAWAQLPPPNGAGVSAGHEHFRAMDVEAATQFWTALGGVVTPVGQGKMPIIKLPGVFVLIARATAENPVTGGTEGSTVDLIRFRVKNLENTLSGMKAAGYQPTADSTRERTYLMAPHGAKLQIVEDPSLSGTVATDSLVMKVPSPAEAAAWYERWFGAKVVRRGQTTYAEIPGMNIEFSETKEPAASTRGRALDHIGFEVRNLEAFMKKLSDGGVNVVRQFGPAPAPYSPTLKGQANVLDPWGTYIELLEGFADVK